MPSTNGIPAKAGRNTPAHEREESVAAPSPRLSAGIFLSDLHRVALSPAVGG